MFVVTKEWILKNKTPRGSWLSSQVKALGWPGGLSTKNWLKRSVGKEITLKQKEEFEKKAFDRPIQFVAKELKATGRKRSKKKLNDQHSLIDRKERKEFVERHSQEFIASAAFLQTMEWKRARIDVLVRYGNTCMCCGARPVDGIYLCVDHIKPRKTHPELALDINNLQILCNNCNAGKGNDFNISWRDSFIAKKVKHYTKDDRFVKIQEATRGSTTNLN